MKLDNENILRIEPLLSPLELRSKLPVSDENVKKILKYREKIQNIMDRKDERFIVIVGPCSIHSIQEAMEYARRLKLLSNAVQEKLFLIMRVYLEKPRTTMGWEGLLYDPKLDGSYNISEGVNIGRKLLLDICELDLPIATEVLHPVTTQYIIDLISYAAIGARTTESQIHKHLASGLSMPVGFKNTTDGNIKIATEAIFSALHKHVFLGLLEDGRSGAFHTKGNKYTHLILRGGKDGPNYTSEHIAYARELLIRINNHPSIIVDCNHSNSGKIAAKQKIVVDDIVTQKLKGDDSIVGIMLESNIFHGKQDMKDLQKIKYGVSVTDECISWEETEEVIDKLYSDL